MNILATSLIIGCLLLIKGMVATKVYKNRLVDLTETIVYFNVLALAASTWYTLDTGKSQDIVAYISVMITFALLVAVITGHVYRYTSLFIMFKNTWLFKQVVAKILVVKKRAKNIGKSKLSALEPQLRSTEGHQEHYEPTHAVVDIHNCQVYSGNYTFDTNIYCDHQ